MQRAINKSLFKHKNLFKPLSSRPYAEWRISRSCISVKTEQTREVQRHESDHRIRKTRSRQQSVRSPTRSTLSTTRAPSRGTTTRRPQSVSLRAERRTLPSRPALRVLRRCFDRALQCRRVRTAYSVAHGRILEDQERWHRTDAIFPCDVLVRVDVDFAEGDLASCGVYGGELLEDRSDGLAGAAPVGVEVDD